MPPRADKASGSKTQFEAWPDHPLFPVEEGEQSPHVAFIHVTRKDLGVMQYGPMMRADELTSLDTIFERFGGGQYELVARGPSVRDPSQPGNITRRRWYPIPGRSKPLSQDPTAAEIRQAEGMRPGEPLSPSPAAPSSSAAAGGMGDNVLVAILQMQQTSSQHFMALMLEMMKSSKGEAGELAKAQAAAQQQMVTMMMTMSGQQQQSMLAMMTAMMSSRGGGPEEMAKYAKLLRDLGVAGAGKTEGDGEPQGFGKMLEDAADFVQGVVALKGAAPGVNGAPMTPPPPGSAAAAVLEGVKP